MKPTLGYSGHAPYTGRPPREGDQFIGGFVSDVVDSSIPLPPEYATIIGQRQSVTLTVVSGLETHIDCTPESQDARSNGTGGIKVLLTEGVIRGIPQELLASAGINGNVVLVGVADHIELWEPTRLQRALSEVEKRGCFD